MEFIKHDIEGLVEIVPKVFGDERGYFFESFNQSEFKKNGIEVDFVQDNQSLSSKGVLRGLHFQSPPYAQDKLVRVIQGSVMDVVVDIRKDSKTYGKHITVVLSGEKQNMLFVPKGFAHGFVTLQDNTIFTYKCSNFYHKASEGGIMWNDEQLSIEWGISNPIISEKDTIQESFESFNSPF